MEGALGEDGLPVCVNMFGAVAQAVPDALALLQGDGSLRRWRDQGEAERAFRIIVRGDAVASAGFENPGHGGAAFPLARQHRAEFAQLNQRHGALDFVDLHVDAHEGGFIEAVLMAADHCAEIVIGPGAGVKLAVIGEDCAAFADVQVFHLVEAEGAEMADAAEGAALVSHAHRLAGIFDDDQAVFPCDGHDRVHVTRRVAHMHGDDGAGVGGDLPLDVFRVDGEGFVDVDKDRNRADHDRGRCGGHPCIGRNEDFIPGADAGGGKSGNQGAGAGGDGQAVARACQLAQGLLELVGEVGLFGIACELPFRDRAPGGDPFTDTHGWHFRASQIGSGQWETVK